MTIVRLAEFPALQAALIKSMYPQVKRFADGIWRNFKAEITINDKPYNFECKYKHDGFFLTLGKRETTDREGRIIAPEQGIYIPTV